MIGHPLFPTEGPEEEPIEVEFIGVRRFQGGALVTAPRMFEATELDSLEGLFDLYGGGTYELEARHGGQSQKQHYSARRRYTLPGPSKPLTGEEPEQPAHGAMMAPTAGLSGDNQLMLMFLKMMSDSQSQTTALMVKAMESNAQILAAVLGSGKGDNTAVLQMMATMSQQDRAQMMDLLKVFAEAKGGGGSGELGAFMKGLNFQQTDAPEPEADPEGDLMSTVQQVMGMAAAGRQSVAGAPVQVPHTPTAAPPGNGGQK